MKDEEESTLNDLRLAPGIGKRIHVIGNSGSGKSTLAARLSRRLNIPLVELDALNWEPNWVGLNDANPEEFERRIREATVGDAWVVAGSYFGFSGRILWPRMQSVVWLDLPLWQLLGRVFVRSWRRWRSKELLWGTNFENFWTHLKLWDTEASLLSFIVRYHLHKRRSMLARMADPQWSHIRFIRLASSSAVEKFLREVEQAVSSTTIEPPASVSYR